MNEAALPRLHPIVQGVEFEAVIDGVPRRAVVLARLLQDHFGAGPAPDDWMRSYAQHRPALQQLAAAAWRLYGIEPVVLREMVYRRLQGDEGGFDSPSPPGRG